MTVAPAYVEDASGFRGYAERVLTPGTEAELLDILREASGGAIPVTIAGAGTGVTGGRVAQGGWVISVEKFNRLEIHQGRAIAGAAVPLAELHAAAARTGQFYAPDPTETAASVGGTIATNASGSRSFRYGDTRRHILRLRTALMDGRVIDAARGDAIDFDVPAIRLPQTTKHTAGYRLAPAMDWIDLITGSEGTLGVVLEAELQLLPAPKELLAGVVFFDGDDRAIDAVDQWRGTEPRMLEYFDGPSLALLRTKFPEVPPAAQAAVLFEVELPDPGDEVVEAWHERLVESQALVEASWFATTANDRDRFRRFRHSLPELVNDRVRRNGYLKMGSDYAVPIARNREMLAAYREVLERYFPGRHVVFGHIGDAHLHANILPASDADFALAKDVMITLAREARSLGGVVSAEHGLGKRKAHLLDLQYEHWEIEAMRAVKRRLDPQWLLGRGTLFSAPPPSYNTEQTYKWNYDHPPALPQPLEVPPWPGAWDFCGIPCRSPIGIPAGPLLNSGWILYYARLGFDVLTYKTVRSRERASFDLPNLVPVDGRALSDSWAISFGMPSKDPAVWREDVARAREGLCEGQVLCVSVVASPESDWSLQQIADDFARCARWAADSGAQVIEANLSCPNVCTKEAGLYLSPEASGRVARTIRDAVPELPLAVKIGLLPGPREAEALVEAVTPYATAISTVNCISGRVPGYFGGETRGIGGASIGPRCLEELQMLAPIAVGRVRVIAVGGVSSAGDIRVRLDAGAHHVQIATAAMLDPHLLSRK
ncbi:MAG: FAD-binding protein [Bryobacterales bacterium]|nr:FAD-binding protein [Bryobacterales bacterium]